MAYSREADRMMQMFGRRLKAARISAGYDDAASFASDLGVGDQAYRKYERGESMPPPDVLLLICNMTSQSLDHLVLGRKMERRAGI